MTLPGFQTALCKPLKPLISSRGLYGKENRTVALTPNYEVGPKVGVYVDHAHFDPWIENL